MQLEVWQFVVGIIVLLAGPAGAVKVALNGTAEKIDYVKGRLEHLEGTKENVTAMKEELHHAVKLLERLDERVDENDRRLVKIETVTALQKEAQ